MRRSHARLLLSLAALAPTLTGPPAARAAGDPLAGRQWGLDQVRAPRAWDGSRGTGVLVGVVDTGLDFAHPDLRANVVPGRTFLECGAKGCGNGHWRSGQRGNPANDGYSVHGTHVAGIVGAVAGNRVGIAGVAPKAKLLAVKVLDDTGGTWEDVARGIRYAADRRAKVINLSLGASAVGWQVFTVAAQLVGTPDAMVDAVRYATAKGALVVAAAGNQATPLCTTPAVVNGAVCVRATDQREAPAWYSNGATKPDGLAVAAPGGQSLGCGEGVLSTIPHTLTWSCGGRGYAELSGTSMAAPHVAGVAALLFAQGRSRAEVARVLTKTARRPAGLPGGAELVLGHGIVDAAAAVAAR